MLRISSCNSFYFKFNYVARIQGMQFIKLHDLFCFCLSRGRKVDSKKWRIQAHILYQCLRYNHEHLSLSLKLDGISPRGLVSMQNPCRKIHIFKYTNEYRRVHAMSMHHWCPFGYFQMNVFFGVDITMDIVWILQPGQASLHQERLRSDTRSQRLGAEVHPKLVGEDEGTRLNRHFTPVPWLF